MDFPKTWLQKMLRYFRIYQSETSGAISKTVYVDDFVARAKAQLGPEQCEKIQNLRETLWTQLMGGDNTRDVTSDQFIANMGAMLKAAQTMTTLRQTFELFFEAVDANNDGMIQPEEFAEILKLYGISPDVATEAFTALDDNNDGLVSKEEFVDGFLSFYTAAEPGSAYQLFGR